MPRPAGFTSLIAARIQDAAGHPLASGTLEMLPTDDLNRAITAVAGGAGGIIAGRASFAVTAGVLAANAWVADVALTSPTNISYRLTIKDPQGTPLGVLAKIKPTGAYLNLDTYSPVTGAAVTGINVADVITGTLVTLSLASGAVSIVPAAAGAVASAAAGTTLIDTITGSRYTLGADAGTYTITPAPDGTPGVDSILLLDQDTSVTHALVVSGGALQIL